MAYPLRCTAISLCLSFNLLFSLLFQSILIKRVLIPLEFSLSLSFYFVLSNLDPVSRVVCFSFFIQIRFFSILALILLYWFVEYLFELLFVVRRELTL
ncbi:hypothetical protein CPB84DRAFT_1770529 [Gymnopilus junonius]|uniref:Uncharacterized protein n=1 Tax=Gymnopilus junonius TaxID=109634 RepID=A0A9P5NU19_GYMJU|nr:hypothetical protein CPB84DRAFT_1770529 [Gymnopilus junonius]